MTKKTIPAPRPEICGLDRETSKMWLVVVCDQGRVRKQKR